MIPDFRALPASAVPLPSDPCRTLAARGQTSIEELCEAHGFDPTETVRVLLLLVRWGCPAVEPILGSEWQPIKTAPRGVLVWVRLPRETNPITIAEADEDDGNWWEWGDSESDLEDLPTHWQPLEARFARPALPQPEPEGPSDEQINQCYAALYGLNTDKIGLMPVRFGRELLARWGRPAVEPVPVSERPWEREGWCDADGRCWWGRPSEELCNSDWFLATRAEVEEFCNCFPPVVSLPHHALPAPEVTP